MALFWTFAEGVILLFIRQGFLFLKTGEGRQKKFLISCAVCFALLACLLFLGEVALERVLDLERGFNRSIYRWALWNFFCTLWVVVEGAFMLYLMESFRALNKRRPVRNGLKYILSLMAFLFFGFYRKPAWQIR